MRRTLSAGLTTFGVLLALANCGDSSGAGVDEAAATPCTTNSDCANNQCSSGTCAQPTGVTSGTAPTPNSPAAATPGAGRSCSQVHGGKTCGPSGNEDCCTTAKQGSFTIDKYLITAGRMRAFIAQFQGNIQGFVDGLGDKWKKEWSEADSLPTDVASANEILGPYANKKSCNQGQYTGHTYWTPKTDDDYSDFDQDTLDEKALNCVPWPLMQALCVWDGGHLATLEELRASFTNGGTTKYPWGDDGLSNVNAPDPEDRLNMEGSFQTTPLPATYRKDPDGQVYEVSFRISPPGRYPKGNNKAGLADVAGNLLEWVGDRPRQFVWKADFEHHAADATLFNGGKWWWEKPLPIGDPWIWGTSQLFGQAGDSSQKNGYYSIGGRCAH